MICTVLHVLKVFTFFHQHFAFSAYKSSAWFIKFIPKIFIFSVTVNGTVFLILIFMYSLAYIEINFCLLVLNPETCSTHLLYKLFCRFPKIQILLNQPIFTPLLYLGISKPSTSSSHLRLLYGSGRGWGPWE